MDIVFIISMKNITNIYVIIMYGYSMDISGIIRMLRLSKLLCICSLYLFICKTDASKQKCRASYLREFDIFIQL